ncbi:MAG: hypothetical protein ONB27_10880 [candidate division KSB1 bacterium]|nr:hypothetical protein [candidate division KSB1 bacterium]
MELIPILKINNLMISPPGLDQTPKQADAQLPRFDGMPIISGQES